MCGGGVFASRNHVTEKPKNMTTNKTLRNVRIVLWALVAVAALGATWLYIYKPPQRPLGINGQSFALNSTQGGTLTEKDLVGTPTREVFLAHRDASASRIGLQHVVAALQAGFVGLADRLSE